MFASDDVVYAWAIGKALLIVTVSFSTLVYAAWVVTRQGKKVARVESPRIVSLAKTAPEARSSTWCKFRSSTSGPGRDAR